MGKKYYRHLVVIIFVLQLISCGEPRHKKELLVGNLEIGIVRFPGVVEVDKYYKGTFEFDKGLDSVDKSSLIESYTFLYVSAGATVDSIEKMDIERIQKTDYKVWTDSLPSGIIEFDIIFREVGLRQLNFVVQDVLLVDPVDSVIRMREIQSVYATTLNIQVTD